ncbi:hypothetical protein ABZP36_010837 [Zizania latifolia]
MPTAAVAAAPAAIPRRDVPAASPADQKRKKEDGEFLGGRARARAWGFPRRGRLWSPIRSIGAARRCSHKRRAGTATPDRIGSAATATAAAGRAIRSFPARPALRFCVSVGEGGWSGLVSIGCWVESKPETNGIYCG